MLTVYSFIVPALISEKEEEGAQVLKEQTRIHSSYSVELGSARIWVEETFLFGWEIAVWLGCNWTFEKSKNSKAIAKLWDWPRYFQGMRKQGLTDRFGTAVVGRKEYAVYWLYPFSSEYPVDGNYSGLQFPHPQCCAPTLKRCCEE